MRMSCNGCRVLRKGCSPECTLRPCLDWIPSPASQANAVLFLAKFYGRAGLVNLINAGLGNLHPEIFKSLLYEACGRIINPVGGATGLMGSGEWARCQAAVDAVLDGSTLLTEVSGDEDSGGLLWDPVQSCNIRRIKRSPASSSTAAAATNEAPEKFTITGWEGRGDDNNFTSTGNVERALRTPTPPPVPREPDEAPSPEPPLELTLGAKMSHL